MDLMKAMELMDLKPGFSRQELHLRWREMARLYHPDLNNSPLARQRFIDYKQAYELLDKRFFGDGRGVRQDCLDRLSRASSQNRCPSRQRLNDQVEGGFWLNVLFRGTLVWLALLALVALASQSPDLRQALYAFQIDMAFVSSTVGAFLLGFFSLFKSRLLIK